MSNKVTWDQIYEDFKCRYPNLSKTVMRWQPFDFATIKLWTNDEMRIIYDYDLQRIIFMGKEN